MAHSLVHGVCNHGALRLVLVLVGLSLVVYAVGPPFYWRLRERSVAKASCPSCFCDCSSEISFPIIPLGIINSTYSDCGKTNPDLNEEMEKDIVALLSEELTLQKAVVNETLQHAKASIRDARKSSSHYQKEAEKCNVGMDTCEEAREKAERDIVEERKLAALWEKRARELGWRDSRRVYTKL
ncbi:DUF1068 domain-containing protein [Cephalotus follicularis]|uniref:DUF1068 domain-containing protein n=1 Tax=Cephalotus follicularis TaxID=3775 RepID=A0A1Q3B585_CEPFO|nr:DUF1068 domain-containing protein [Cephalotus follicularis]